MEKRNLSFGQLVNLSFGFFGVQIAYALQSANISRIFATLGADPHKLSFFWILPPLMGMIVQPLIGKYSDRTWTRLGRRKPYLLLGALIAVMVMILLPNAGSLGLNTAYVLLGLNSAMWFGLFALMFLDVSINVAMQPFKMMVGDMVNEEQKTLAYSIQSFLCNAGSLVGFLCPFILTRIGVENEAVKGVVPDSVVWSFYIGAIILILCVLYTFLTVKEMDPVEYAKFHNLEDKKEEKQEKVSLIKLLADAPKTFWTVGLVQFFCWAAFLYMWNYTTGAVAENCWNTTDTASGAYQAAGNWVGVMFAVQAVGSILWAVVIPMFKNKKVAYSVSLLLGGIGFASIMFVHNPNFLYPSFLLIGCAWAAMLALPFTLLTNALEGKGNMGYYLGLFNCTICLPQIVAAIVGAPVVKYLFHESQVPMLVVAGALLICGAAAVSIINEKE